VILQVLDEGRLGLPANPLVQALTLATDW